MAAIRKASSYTKKRVRPYTRKSSRKQKAYIKTVPVLMVVKYQMGNEKSFREGRHNYTVKLISEEKVQLRDNAIEAARMFISKSMDTNAPGQYYFSIKVYPHHILREHKMAAGAGADRLSSGMSQSFGVTVGRAAIVQPGKEIFFISCENEKTARSARDALRSVKAKMPCKCRIIFKKVK